MKIYLEVYGCTANKSDASIVKGIALERGHDIVDGVGDASIILTCTVIGTTEQRMLSRIEKLSKGGKTLIVSGCMAAVQPDKIRKVSPNAIIIPPNQIHSIVDVLEERRVSSRWVTKTSLPRYYNDLIAPIAISEGCNFSCSYCITTKARGGLISYPIEEIVETAKDAIEKGIKEIQLTAQDVASYGMDMEYSEYRLSELIHRICSINESFRIRIGMMNPHTVLPQLNELVDAYANEKVYKFLHLPVQSGDNKILKRMNRRYSIEDFIKIVKVFRSKFRDLTLSTDIIVGFPGEDEESFAKSVELLKRVKPDIVNITRFSPRSYTKAKEFRDRIETRVAKERSRLLTRLSKELGEQINRRYIDRVVKVVIIERGKGSTVVGRSNAYKPVVIPSKLPLGSFERVRIVDARETYLVGKLI